MKYTIAQAARKMKLTTYALRYYDREGLLPNVERNRFGNRVFADEDMEMLSLICCLKNTGMPLREIKRFVTWQNEGDHTLHARDSLLLEHKANVLAQIENLKNYLQVIDRKLEYYQDACLAYDEGRPIPCCCIYPR